MSIFSQFFPANFLILFVIGTAKKCFYVYSLHLCHSPKKGGIGEFSNENATVSWEEVSDVPRRLLGAVVAVQVIAPARVKAEVSALPVVSWNKSHMQHKAILH